MALQPIILAGGVGTRLWPLSRELYPKQVLKLTGSLSLLQNTVKRLTSLGDVRPPLVVTGEEHRFLVKDQMEELQLFPHFELLLEPVSKNTAPALCGAANYVEKKGHQQDVLLVLPADHLVLDQAAFCRAVEQAIAPALAGKLVTFGIQPYYPETGYGYIEQGQGDQVLAFVEKPDEPTAQSYLASGRYLWNSGMFAFTSQTLLTELRYYAPEITTAMHEAVQRGQTDGVFFRFAKEAMQSCPSDSLDYAVMEKSSRVALVRADMGWSDIGSWRALWEMAEKDAQGNAVSGDVLLDDVHNSLIRAEDSLVTAIGLDNMLVVETADALLVAPMDRAQDVKKIVGQLKEKNREELVAHRTVHRPWGTYTLLEAHKRFLIKRIMVRPGARLSLQLHHHRYEHWVVVSGTAQVRKGEQSLLLQENEAIFIPCGTPHRLENPGIIPLELIEIQIGSYLGEDDIVRFDDAYGRVSDLSGGEKQQP